MTKTTTCDDAFDFPELDKMNVKEFVRIYQNFMYSITQDQGLDHNQATLAIDDVLITIFMKHACYFDPKKNRFSNYLATMVRNACRSVKRRERHYVNVEEGELTVACENNGAVTYDRACTAAEIRRCLEEAVSILRKEVRSQLIVDAFVMMVIDEERPVDVAQKLNVRADYVSLAKNRYLPRFRAILRGVMEKDN